MNGEAAQKRRYRKRSEILAVARAILFREGYAAASMAEIAARVGGSKATLYSHFRSKQELLVAVVEDVLGGVEGDPAEMPPPDDFRAWLAWFGMVTIARLTSHDLVSVQRLAAAEAVRFPDLGRIVFERGVVPSFDMVTPWFARAMEAGVLRRGDPRLAAELFIELCTGWMLRRMVWNIAPLPTYREMQDRIRAAVSLFMDGYAVSR